MRSAFDDWWDSDYDDSTNPYTKDSACYWAWAGWQAAKAESRSYREAYPDNFVKEWVGLTDEEMRELEKQFNAERVRTSDEEYLVIYPADYWNWQRAIEAKLKEKNT